jgi:Na+/melibiose symporter-like transporter
MEFLIILSWVILGGLSAYFAQQRGRSPQAWFFIGLVFGIFGLIMLFILSPLTKENDAITVLPQPLEGEVLPVTNPEDNKDWFYVDQNYNQQGPVSYGTLLSLLDSQILTNESLVWSEGMSDWKEIRELDK